MVWYKQKSLILDTAGNKAIKTDKRLDTVANKELNAIVDKNIDIDKR